MRVSKMRAKTGEVKERTMRSPMGMRVMAARQPIVTLDMSRPYSEIIVHWKRDMVPCFSLSRQRLKGKYSQWNIPSSFRFLFLKRMTNPKMGTWRRPLTRATSVACSWTQLTR